MNVWYRKDPTAWISSLTRTYMKKRVEHLALLDREYRCGFLQC